MKGFDLQNPNALDSKLYCPKRIVPQLIRTVDCPGLVSEIQKRHKTQFMASRDPHGAAEEPEACIMAAYRYHELLL